MRRVFAILFIFFTCQVLTLFFFQAGAGFYCKLTHAAFDPSMVRRGELLAAILATANGITILLLLLFRYVKWRELFRCGVKPIVVLSCILAILFTMFDMNVFTEKLHLTDIFEQQFQSLAYSPLGLLSMVLLAPFAEEMVFRVGIEGHLLHTGYKPWKAILLSALLFSVIHGNPAQMPGAFVAGILFAWLYYRTASPLPGILGHVLNNLWAVIMMRVYSEPNVTMEKVVGGTQNLWVLVVISLVLITGLVWYINRQTRNVQRLSSENNQ
jgi:membrane protease YdiL (CAAX protease family)